MELFLVLATEGVLARVSPSHFIMQESYEEASESTNDFEVVYDEVYDPEREQQLKKKLSEDEGCLSAYWARNAWPVRVTL